MKDLLPQAVTLVELLKARGLTCATAESCTGGGVGAAITAVPGSSAVFAGGIISYSNDIKNRILGVSTADLANFGAVSAPVAAQMAQGARQLLKTDFAIAITGIAGPDGGSDEKPVGLVWFARASAIGIHTEKALFVGNRATIRAHAILHALGLLTTAPGVL